MIKNPSCMSSFCLQELLSGLNNGEIASCRITRNESVRYNISCLWGNPPTSVVSEGSLMLIFTLNKGEE